MPSDVEEPLDAECPGERPGPGPAVGVGHGRGGHGMIEDDRDAPRLGDLQRFDPAGELQVDENVHVDPADDRVTGVDLVLSGGPRQDFFDHGHAHGSYLSCCGGFSGSAGRSRTIRRARLR